MNRVAILLTCFNRKQRTLRCLQQLFILKQDIDVYLVDDQSADGTSEAIARQFEQVNIIHGSGNLFWSRGMHLAWQNAAVFNYDFYIWLNDDVELYVNAFQEIFVCSEIMKDHAIISGIIETKDTMETIYGGTSNRILIRPNGKMNYIENLNGNFVLVPRSVFKVLGNLDPVFHHDLGDVDYGLRAKKNNINVFTTRVAIGSGEINNICRVRLANSSITKRFKKLYSPLGNHPNINFYFRKKHYGYLNAISYYIYIHAINLFPDKFIKLLFGSKYN
jgi:GT2 family glycosyltransferase